MVSALNDHVIDGQDSFWHDDATWRGPVGAGVKPSLQAFKDGWQKPFLNAFPDKVTTDAVVLADGEWAAAFGEVEATHTGEFLGLPGDGRKKTLRYSNSWRIEGDRLAENWVMIDHIALLQQLGINPLGGSLVYPPDNSAVVNSLATASSAPGEGLINQGLVNEKHIANLARGTTLLRLGKSAIITSLARDKARSMGITIEKVK